MRLFPYVLSARKALAERLDRIEAYVAHARAVAAALAALPELTLLPQPPPTNMFHVGNWVTGDEFYGRRELRTLLCVAPDRAIAVLGTRRVGKTSLLRQVALDLAPLGVYVDLVQAVASVSGETTLDEGRLVRLLRRELGRLSRASPALEATRAAWERDSRELCTWLEEATWAWEEHGATVTLLWDEAELLQRLATPSLMGLRALVQSGVGLRLVLCASKGLAAINDRWRDSCPAVAG